MTGVLLRMRWSGNREATRYHRPEEHPPLKSAEDRMHIVDKYREPGSYRAAGKACGVDHKTLRTSWPASSAATWTCGANSRPGIPACGGRGQVIVLGLPYRRGCIRLADDVCCEYA